MTAKSTASSNVTGAKNAAVDKKQHSSHNLIRQKTSFKESTAQASSSAPSKPATKVKVAADKGKNDKKKEEEPEPNPWPPFTFDGSNALKTRLVINLRNCQYDLFR